MKRIGVKHLTWAAALAALLLCALADCQCTDVSPTVLPDKSAITAALEGAGLPGVISEEETMTGAAGSITYVVRDPAKTYSGTDNPVLVASVTGGTYQGERVLSFSFDQSVASEQINWSDWRRQLTFVALVSGGPEDENEIFRAFLGKEVPLGQERCRWEAPLTDGYCVIKWSHRSQKRYDADGFELREHHASLWVNVYASQAQYEALTTERQGEARS